MDDLSGLEVEFRERLASFIAEERRYKLTEKEASEAIRDFLAEDEEPVAPLNDSWFWPNNEQPIAREPELEPFWR